MPMVLISACGLDKRISYEASAGSHRRPKLKPALVMSSGFSTKGADSQYRLEFSPAVGPWV